MLCTGVRLSSSLPWAVRHSWRGDKPQVSAAETLTASTCPPVTKSCSSARCLPAQLQRGKANHSCPDPGVSITHHSPGGHLLPAALPALPGSSPHTTPALAFLPQGVAGRTPLTSGCSRRAGSRDPSQNLEGLWAPLSAPATRKHTKPCKLWFHSTFLIVVWG